MITLFPTVSATAWLGQNAGLVVVAVGLIAAYMWKAACDGSNSDGGSDFGSSDCSGDGDGGCD